MKPLFDPVKFGQSVRRKLETTGLSLREAATEVGTDHCNIQRVTAGKPPSVETYLRLVRWLEQH